MDYKFSERLITAPEVERDIGFDTQNDPILKELVEKACYISYEEIDKLPHRIRHHFEALARAKVLVLEATAKKLEDAEFGQLHPVSREGKPVAAIVKMGIEDLIVEDTGNNKRTHITRGMAIEAARWNSFDGVAFELGMHGAEVLHKIIRSRALQELEELRDMEMAQIMMETESEGLRDNFEKKSKTIGSALKDKKGGEIAEELVGSWIRTLCEDGLIPFSFSHGDIIDDVMYHMDFIIDVPSDLVSPTERIQGVSHVRHAVDFTVNGDSLGGKKMGGAELQRGIQRRSRGESRTSEEKVHKTHVISYKFPHREGDYVKDWMSWKQGTFRGPEMALDSTTRERLMDIFLSRICTFMPRENITAAIRKMNDTYRGMYRN